MSIRNPFVNKSDPFAPSLDLAMLWAECKDLTRAVQEFEQDAQRHGIRPDELKEWRDLLPTLSGVLAKLHEKTTVIRELVEDISTLSKRVAVLTEAMREPRTVSVNEQIM